MKYPKSRRLIQDLIREGRRKNLFHILFEADITDIQQQIKHYAARYKLPLSLTTYLVKAFALTINQDKSVQAYRLGRSKLKIFDDIDVCMMIERELEDHRMPIAYTIRRADQKTIRVILKEMRHAKTAPLGTAHPPMPAALMRFFKLPTVFRKIIWRFVQRYPIFLKKVVGTVGVTSINGYGSEGGVAIVDSPMTLTLCIGGILPKVILQEDKPVERYYVQLALCIDHDILDGAPIMQFIERFKETLRQHEAVLCH